MSADLLRKAAETLRERAASVRRPYGPQERIDVALADLLTHVADDAESNDMFDGFDPWITVPAYGDALTIARLIVEVAS